jgi:uncharacterized membrane protein YfhO
LFGEDLLLYRDIGNDSYYQVYSYVTALNEYFQTHHLFSWSFLFGVGQPIVGLFWGDIFNWPLFLIPKDSIPYGIILMEVLKIFLTGFFYCKYLKLKRYSSIICIFGSISILFSSYIILNASWFNYFSYAAFLLIFWLYSVEKLKRNQPIYFIIVVFLTGINQPFDYYFFGLFTLIYLWIQSETYLIHFSILKKITGYGLLGIGLGILPIYQNCLALLNGPRALMEYSFYSEISQKPLFQFSTIQEIQTNFLQFFSPNIQGIGDQYGGFNIYVEAPLYFISSFCFLLLLNNKKTSIQRNKQIALTLLILTFIFVPFFRYSILLFIGNYYRIVAFGIALLIFENGLKVLNNHIQQTHEISWLKTFVLFLIFIIGFIVFRDNKPNFQYTKSLFLIVLNFSLLLLYLSKRGNSPILLAILTISIADGFYESHLILNKRPKVTTTQLKEKKGFNDYSVEAIQWLKRIDKGLYRIEKDVTSGDAITVISTNDAMIQDYYGTRLYTSFNHSSYIKFLKSQEALEFNTEWDTRWVKVPPGRIEIYNNLGVKYMFSTTNIDWTKAGYRLIRNYPNLKVYQNLYFLQIGSVLSNVISEDNYLNQPLAKKTKISQKYLILPAKNIEEITKKTSQQPSIKSSENSDTFLNITNFKEYLLEGDVYLKEPSLLYFSIPLDKGWKAEVNGKTTEVIKANFGMMAVYLEPGDNHVVLEYGTPHKGYLIVINTLSVLLLIVINIKNQILNKRTINK